MTTRDDAYCPACPDPETAFRIKDVGMKFETEGDMRRGDSVSIKATRPAWEPIMLAHIEIAAEDDDAHRRLYDECMLALAGRSAEQAARDEAEAAVGLTWRWLGDAPQPLSAETMDLRPQLFAGIPRRLAELSPWTDRINSFNRRVLEENR